MNDKHLNRIGKALKDKYEELKIDKQIKERRELIEKAMDENEIKAICMIDFYSPLNKWIKANITAEEFNIAYSYNGLRFDVIFNLKEKAYIGSNANTINRLYSAVKFQMIANYSNYEELNTINKTRVAFFYGCKLLKCINNSCTFNNIIPDISTGLSYKNYIYKPIDWDWLTKIAGTVVDEIEKENYDIYDVSNITHSLNIKKQNTRYHMKKRIEKEELEKLIIQYKDEYKEDPTINDLCNYYTMVYNIEEIEDLEEYNAKRITSELMRKYIGLYDLKEMIKPIYNTQKNKA